MEVAVVGSGMSGLLVAALPDRTRAQVTVYERNWRTGETVAPTRKRYRFDTFGRTPSCATPSHTAIVAQPLSIGSALQRTSVRNSLPTSD
ncbi:MAG: NAD(P)/FAD-dependent oxidoreductase [Sphingomonadales bacterium]|nr:NAD(P)/FAD-dependent oxidoreductase [Sphingomonadales bacterium]